MLYSRKIDTFESISTGSKHMAYTIRRKVEHSRKKYEQGNVTSVSLKIEPLQYIAIYYNGSIFNETDFI